MTYLLTNRIFSLTFSTPRPAIRDQRHHKFPAIRLYLCLGEILCPGRGLSGVVLWLPSACLCSACPVPSIPDEWGVPTSYLVRPAKSRSDAASETVLLVGLEIGLTGQIIGRIETVTGKDGHSVNALIF